MRWLPLVLVLAVTAGLAWWFWPQITAAVREGRSYTEKGESGRLSTEEQLVRRHILDRADDPSSVEFAQWGPHATKGELTARKVYSHIKWQDGDEGVDTPAVLIRVVYREKNKLGALERHESVFQVEGGKLTDYPRFLVTRNGRAVPLSIVPSAGDDWIERTKESVKRSEAIRRQAEENWKRHSLTQGAPDAVKEID